jgi:anti-anti-sigma factor
VFVTDMEGAGGTRRRVGISRGKAVKGSDAVHLLREAPTDGSALLVDISRVPFIDSSGLNVLLHLARRLSGELVLLRPSRGVARLFRLTGAERFPGLTVSYSQAA